ncbi:MAG: hydrolase [Candidatus Sumerlaeia bacterium]
MAAQLQLDEALLAVIDMQGKLLPAISERDSILNRVELLVRSARILDVPILWTEQYPRGIGPTVASIESLIGDAARPIDKLCFGCFGDERAASAASATGRRQLVVCGVEAHVCVLQTVLTALSAGWTVFVAEDAVGSRRNADRDVSLERMRQAGAIPTTAESAIMELLATAAHAKFREILPLIKG